MRHFRGVLSGYRYGAGDPTTQLSATDFWRATHTPEGEGTLHLEWSDGTMRAEAWGPGGDWLLAHVPALVGDTDPGYVFTEGHAAVLAAQRDHPDVRFGASGTLYHELIPTVLGQRITAGEATLQWYRLVRDLGRPAPGPSDLLLPPDPDDLAGRPLWWFHPLGIEAKRAATLKEIGRRASHLHDWSALPPADAAAKLALLPGIGPWTIGSVLRIASGDPDALAVGDFHLKNVVVHALTGRARGTDDEMMELLAPYAPQRGRAVTLLLLAGHSAPKFGPRRRVLPTRKW